MSSFMRTIERQKVRTQMYKNGVRKVNKKLKPWWTEYKKKVREYLAAKKLKEQQNG